MPKKKGKKGKKAKGKGKKEGKQESKAEKESDLERAKAHAALWEARLDVTEQSRVEYREAARRLAKANEELASQQYRAEKDTVDVITLLRKKDLEKEAKIAALEKQLKDQKTKALEEKEQVVAEYSQQVSALEERFKKRSDEFRTIQAELKTIREFRKMKAHMAQELLNMKESMRVADRQHNDSLAQMEHKFFSEKVRLEQEAEQRLAQQAESAHTEAVAQLDEATRSVFRENVRLRTALELHEREAGDERRRREAVEQRSAQLSLQEETTELLMRVSVAQATAQRAQISALRSKVGELERALGVTSAEFERARAEERARARARCRAGEAELEKLQKVLALRERELGRVRRLAHSVVQQRSEVELFLHSSLQHVRQEILTNRTHYRQEALGAYRHRMAAARSGRQQYPPIRTFHALPHSTNTVYSDLQEAQHWSSETAAGVTVSELTWEQRERVLNLLFAKMNGLQASRGVARPPAPPGPLDRAASADDSGSREAGVAEDQTHMTFITQAEVSTMASDPCTLPDLLTS